jgi:hypothetical protein
MRASHQARLPKREARRNLRPLQVPIARMRELAAAVSHKTAAARNPSRLHQPPLRMRKLRAVA